MVKAVIEERFVEIPEEVQVTVEGRRVTVSGPKGTLERVFSKVPVNIELTDGKVRVWALWPKKKEKKDDTVLEHLSRILEEARSTAQSVDMEVEDIKRFVSEVINMFVTDARVIRDQLLLMAYRVAELENMAYEKREKQKVGEEG